MKRRSFLTGLLAGAAALLLPFKRTPSDPMEDAMRRTGLDQVAEGPKMVLISMVLRRSYYGDEYVSVLWSLPIAERTEREVRWEERMVLPRHLETGYGYYVDTTAGRRQLADDAYMRTKLIDNLRRVCGSEPSKEIRDAVLATWNLA